MRLAWYIVQRVLKALAAKIREDIATLMNKILPRTAWPLFLIVSARVAVRYIAMPPIGVTILGYALMAVIVVYVILSMHGVVDFSIRKLVSKKEEQDQAFSTPIINLVGLLTKIALWIIAFIFIIANLGYNITTLVTGLGIGGLVIAFGLQRVMQDLFASFTIHIDRPFVPGDFIIIGNDLGTVKEVGIKSTRIQHLGGQELIVSNRELTDVRIHNYKRMERRRIVFHFGVVYQTPPEKLKMIPDMVKSIIGEIETAQVDRVHFKEYGDFSLNFEVVYYVGTPDYVVYMDIQQRINLALAVKFKEEQIEFAYPTQTIFLEKQENVT
jgi:small-conductance mechanosensitive channel